jgi:hypothetical protein
MPQDAAARIARRWCFRRLGRCSVRRTRPARRRPRCNEADLVVEWEGRSQARRVGWNSSAGAESAVRDTLREWGRGRECQSLPPGDRGRACCFQRRTLRGALGAAAGVRMHP